MRDLDLGIAFNVLVAWDSFFHLRPEEQRAMFGTFHRHTAPGGVLLLTSGATGGEAVGGDLFGDELYHASLNTDEYARLLEGHGYSVMYHVEEDRDCGDHTIWIARLRDAQR